MPLFGAHLSIAGGLHKAVESAVELGMETLQIFTKSPSQWEIRTGPRAAKNAVVADAVPAKAARSGQAIPEADVAEFRRATKASGLKFVTAHDSYLINLASADEALWQKSLTAFVEEVIRAEQLGLSYLVMHPGAHLGAGEEAGLKRVIEGLDETHRQTLGVKVKVLVELTAGQGSSLGHRFEHLATIFDGVEDPKRLGVCMDTCHVFAAGYPLAPEADYQRTMAEFDRLIGLKQLRLFHLNDSKKPQGSRVDRHEQLGKGHLGAEPFRLIVNDARFAKLPMILETPKTNDADEQMDPVNMAFLRELRGD